MCPTSALPKGSMLWERVRKEQQLACMLRTAQPLQAVTHVLELLLHVLLHPGIRAAGWLRLLLRLLPPGEQYEVLVLHATAANSAPAGKSSYPGYASILGHSSS